jgi:hypothetical protein
MTLRVMRFLPRVTGILWLTLLPLCANAQRPSTAPPMRTAQPDARTAAVAGDAPRITFRRLFKSSTPELIEITVPAGSEPATYEIRQLDDDPGSNPFEISDALRSRIFSLAGELHHFQGQDLDVHRKIANLGEKTFRWQQGAIVYETKFNYTLNAPATQLLQIFEGLARQQEHLELLTRRMKYDRLGINDALMDCDTDFSRGLLPEPQALLPVLDQIAADGHVVDIARQRARTLAERIRHPKT